MNICDLILLIAPPVISIILAIIAVRSPAGYEDESGFHLGSPRK